MNQKMSMPPRSRKFHVSENGLEDRKIHQSTFTAEIKEARKGGAWFSGMLP
jgi:hypothetical protein